MTPGLVGPVVGPVVGPAGRAGRWVSQPRESDGCVSDGRVLATSHIRNHRLLGIGSGLAAQVATAGGAWICRHDASRRIPSARIAPYQVLERFDQRLIRQMSPCRSLGGRNGPDGRPRQCRQAWSGRHDATKPPRSDCLAVRTPPNAPATCIWRTTARDDVDNRARDDVGAAARGTTRTQLCAAMAAANAAGTRRWPLISTFARTASGPVSMVKEPQHS